MTQEKGYIYCQIWGKEFQVLSASGEVDWLGTGQESLHHSQTHTPEGHLAIADKALLLEKGGSGSQGREVI